MKLTKAVLLGFLFCALIERGHGVPAHTVRGVVISTDGAVIPEFSITVRAVSQNPELCARKRFKNGEFTISGLTKDRYQLQIHSPLYIPARLDFDFNSSTRPTDYPIVILHSYRNERRVTPGEEYAVSAKTLQEKIPAEAEDAYLKGVALHREGRLPEALIQYGTAIRIYPNFVRALGDLSAVYILFNRPESALMFLRRANQIDNHDVVIKVNMGIALTEQRDYAGAMKLFKNVLTVSPRLAFAHYYVARIHYLQKKYEDAEQSIRKAIENDPHMLEASMLMIDITLQQRKYDQAREALLGIRQAIDNKIISRFIDEQLATLASLTSGSD
jgi:tetratricopeptide (TPR) repeat protein